ncbi:MAG: hypothetical protein L0323_15875 [Planctomycetes bacterium]|nr:hypothetical protein [Planctomycetota bacterium]
MEPSRSSSPAGLLALAAVLSLCAPARPQSLPTAVDRGLARLVPPDAIALVSFPDLAGSIEEAKSLPFGKILAGAEMKEFLAGPLQALGSEFEGVRSQVRQVGGPDPGVVLSTRWKGLEVALARARFGDRGFEWGIAARIDAGEGWAGVREQLGRVVELARGNPGVGRMEERKVGERTWVFLHAPDPGLEAAFFWTNDGPEIHLVVGSASGGWLGEHFGRIAEGKGGPSLAEEPDFLACAKRSSAAPEFRVFLRTRPLLDLLAVAADRFRGQVPPFVTGTSVRALAAALGLDGLRALALTSTAEKDCWVNDLVLLAPAPRRGLLALGEGATPDRELLKRVPAEAVSFSAGSLPLAALWDALLAGLATLGKDAEEPAKAALAAFEEKNGIQIRRDLLGALGDGAVSYSMPSQGLFAPGESAWLIRLRDPAAFEKGAPAIANALSGAVPFIQTRETAHEGTTIRSFSIRPGTSIGLPQGLPFNPVAMVSPGFAVKGDLLVFSMNVQSLRRALTRLASEPGPGAETSPGYRRFAARVPEKASSISYGDPRPTWEMGHSIASGVLPAVASGSPFDWSAIPPVEALTAPLFGSVSYSEADAEAIHRRTFSSFGADGDLLLVAGLAGGAAAAVALRPAPVAAAAPARAPADLLAGLEVHPLEHVRFLTDADKETAQQLGVQAEATYAHMSRLLGGEPRELPLLLYGYATTAGYNRFAGSFGDDHASVYGGYIATREASAPAVATIESKDWASLHLRHALAHIYVRRLAGPERSGAIPPWFEEGLATYVERFADESLRSWSIDNLKRRGGPGSLAGFGRTFRLDAADPEASQRRMLEAGLLLAYFAHGSDGAELGNLKTALRALREGTRREVEESVGALLADEKGLEERVRAFAGSR